MNCSPNPGNSAMFRMSGHRPTLAATLSLMSHRCLSVTVLVRISSLASLLLRIRVRDRGSVSLALRNHISWSLPMSRCRAFFGAVPAVLVAVMLPFFTACGSSGGGGSTTPTLKITTQSLPGGAQRTSYNASLTATGGTAPYSWSIPNGSLPTGLSLTAGTGVISGMPTSTGTSSFTVQVTDSESPARAVMESLSINIASSSTSAPITGTTSSPTTAMMCRC